MPNQAGSACVQECLPPKTIVNCQCQLSETYTLTLTPDKATIEPNQSATFTATVTKSPDDGAPANVTVSLEVKVDATSGGHSHGGSSRPQGSISPTAGTNSFSINFTATPVSGIHTITATCDLCENKTVDAKVNVMVKEAMNDGFVEITANTETYAVKDSKGNVVGATQHSHNHYLTPAAITNLKLLADAYNTTINPGQLLYLNDASLEWGGLFDVGGTHWQTPHKGHRRGMEVDVRAAAAANGEPVKEGAIPFDYFWQVWNEAKKEGIKADLHCMENQQLVIGSSCYWLPESRHFHVNLK
jgi:hypothetical protein